MPSIFLTENYIPLKDHISIYLGLVEKKSIAEKSAMLMKSIKFENVYLNVWIISVRKRHENTSNGYCKFIIRQRNSVQPA